jgi:hypothetical protein
MHRRHRTIDEDGVAVAAHQADDGIGIAAETRRQHVHGTSLAIAEMEDFRKRATKAFALVPAAEVRSDGIHAGDAPAHID